MTFKASKAIRTAVWSFPIFLVVSVAVGMLFEQFTPYFFDWSEHIARALLLTAVFSVLAGRRVAR
ncbi:hypothetical protein [Aurantiacibacter luteus]|uniref:hypothetical protein n=1 Tax=Aurantiacibacter luteus TaxID=1581420 RepID=UPI0012DFEF98|nr:hypothetical protein [Aurantiacibacter luteus]